MRSFHLSRIEPTPTYINVFFGLHRKKNRKVITDIFCVGNMVFDKLLEIKCMICIFIPFDNFLYNKTVRLNLKDTISGNYTTRTIGCTAVFVLIAL